MNEEFLDIDFDKQPEYVHGYLGIGSKGELFSSYESVASVMTDSQIDAAIEALDSSGGGAERLITRIFNQKNEGSCVANASCQANEITQARQIGKGKVIHLSAISLYKRIGSSPNSGAMVSDGIDEMAKRGVLPLDTPENRKVFGDAVMSNTGYYTKYPPKWEEVSKLFKGSEWTQIRSTQALYTALCRCEPVVVGRQGHSICYVRPMRKNGKRYVKYVNSWGQWGDAGGDFQYGFGYDSESTVKQSAQWCFALRTVVGK